MGLVRSFAAVAVSAFVVSACPLVARAAPTTPASPPLHDDVESARTHYKRGVQLYEQGAYTEALAELRRAEQLAPTYKLLYNLALVQMRLGDWAGALHSLDSYLEGGGAEISAARRAEVERFRVDSTAHLATLTVTTNVDGAQIAVDDVVVGTTPLPAPLQINPGPHRVVATKAGAPIVSSKDVDLASGQRMEVPLTLTEPAPPPETPPAQASPPPPTPVAVPTPEPAPRPPLPPAHARPPTWIGWAITGTLAAGSLATGVAALAESHTLGSELATPTSGSTIHSTHATTVGLALASDILGGAALIAAGVTVYVTLASPAVSPSSAHAAPRTMSAAAVLPTGVALTATF